MIGPVVADQRMASSVREHVHVVWTMSHSKYKVCPGTAYPERIGVVNQSLAEGRSRVTGESWKVLYYEYLDGGTLGSRGRGRSTTVVDVADVAQSALASSAG